MKKLKKQATLLLASTLLLSAMAIPAMAEETQTPSNYYSDLDTAVYTDELEIMSALNIMEGYEDGTIRPEATVTRAEATKIALVTKFGNEAVEEMIAELNSEIASGEAKQMYRDVALDAWYAPYVHLASEHKMVSGRGDGTETELPSFAPTSEVTIAEAYKLICTAIGYESADMTGDEWVDKVFTFAGASGILATKESVSHSLETSAEHSSQTSEKSGSEITGKGVDYDGRLSDLYDRAETFSSMSVDELLAWKSDLDTLYKELGPIGINFEVKIGDMLTKKRTELEKLYTDYIEDNNLFVQTTVSHILYQDIPFVSASREDMANLGCLGVLAPTVIKPANTSNASSSLLNSYFFANPDGGASSVPVNSLLRPEQNTPLDFKISNLLGTSHSSSGAVLEKGTNLLGAPINNVMLGDKVWLFECAPAVSITPTISTGAVLSTELWSGIVLESSMFPVINGVPSSEGIGTTEQLKALVESSQGEVSIYTDPFGIVSNIVVVDFDVATVEKNAQGKFVLKVVGEPIGEAEYEVDASALEGIDDFLKVEYIGIVPVLADGIWTVDSYYTFESVEGVCSGFTDEEITIDGTSFNLTNKIDIDSLSDLENKEVIAYLCDFVTVFDSDTLVAHIELASTAGGGSSSTDEGETEDADEKTVEGAITIHSNTSMTTGKYYLQVDGKNRFDFTNAVVIDSRSEEDKEERGSFDTPRLLYVFVLALEDVVAKVTYDDDYVVSKIEVISSGERKGSSDGGGLPDGYTPEDYPD